MLQLLYRVFDFWFLVVLPRFVFYFCLFLVFYLVDVSPFLLINSYFAKPAQYLFLDENINTRENIPNNI